MANQRTIQQRINHGGRIAARHLGALCCHYRPRDNGPVIVNLNMIDELMVAFDPDASYGFGKPAGFKSDVYFGLLDMTTVAIGDYLSDLDAQTYYVANFEPLKPPMMVRCNRTISVFEPHSGNGYGASTAPQLKLNGWPASIQSGTKGERNIANLPESVRAPWVVIHMPEVPGVIVNYGDIVTDEMERRYIVSDTTRTALGWALDCDYANA